MSKYTVELRSLIENGVTLFDFQYPLYDENHREELERKIIDHYYFREIGFETVGRFKHYLRVKMNEIMPKYNRIYKALAENEINIFSNMKTSADETMTGETIVDRDTTNNNTNVVDRDKTSVVDKDTTNSNTNVVDRDTTNSNTNVVDSDGTDNETNERLYSDTPQGRTTLVDGQYATDLTKDTKTNTATVDTTTTDNGTTTEDITTTDTGSGTEDVTTTDTEDVTTTDTGSGSEDIKTNDSRTKTGGVTGYQGITEMELLEKYMEMNTNVDNMIIVELNELFMRVY